MAKRAEVKGATKHLQGYCFVEREERQTNNATSDSLSSTVPLQELIIWSGVRVNMVNTRDKSRAQPKFLNA